MVSLRVGKTGGLIGASGLFPRAETFDGVVCDTRGVIRPYTDDDLGEVLDAWYLASLEAHSFLSEDFFDAERERLSDMWLPGSDTSVFEVGGHVVGFVSMVGNEVGGIFVTPERQNQGVGRALRTTSRPLAAISNLTCSKPTASHNGSTTPTDSEY